MGRGQALVVDVGVVAAAQFTADIRAQPGGAAGAGSKGSNSRPRMAGGNARVPWLQTCSRTASFCACVLTLRASLPCRGMLPGVIQQIDHDAAQMVGLEPHQGVRGVQRHAHLSGWRMLFSHSSELFHFRVEPQNRSLGRRVLLQAGNVEHVMNNAPQALGVVPNQYR